MPGTVFHDRYRAVSEQRIVDMLVLAGWAYESDDPGAAVSARDALRRWVDDGLEYLTSRSGERHYDPVEVWTVMKRLGREGRDRVFHDRYVATGRRLVTDLARSAASDGRFAIEYRRVFHPAGVSPGTPLRLRLPLPLERMHPDRSLAILGEAIEGHAVGVHGDRLELRCEASEAPPALAVRMAFSAPLTEAAGDDMGVYLRPREGLVVVGERIHALARRLAGPGSTVEQAVRSFWLFLIEGFAYVPIHYDQVDRAAPCDWVLDTGCYDCRLGAALFVALCRARGIPARIVGGHVLYRRAPTNHFWAEFRCGEGWTSVDFLGWDLSGGGSDPIWRDRFFGRVDARLVTEVLPRRFTGPVGVAIPRAWHMLQTAAGEGIAIALTALDGRPVYEDGIRVLG